MIEYVTKYQKTTKLKYKFSLLIPTWNNIKFLQNCINSIKSNSYYSNDLQIVIIVNEGIDGTVEWLKEQSEIDFVHAEKNIGICYALNISRSLIKSDYVVYINDDMYMLPNWDLAFEKEILNLKTKNFMLSGTMIEPINKGNNCIVVKDYGKDLEHFDEKLLLNEYMDLFREDWNGSTWPPCVLHIDLWDLVGGMSIEFSPGMYSDPDLSRKLFEVGVRIFKGKGNSLVYHFGAVSTKRVKRNNGRKVFIQKWGMTSRTFTKEYLKLGESYSKISNVPKLSSKSKFINKIKRIKSVL